MENTTMANAKIMSYLAYGLNIRLSDGKNAEITGFSPSKGFLHGLSQFIAKNFTPVFMPISNVIFPDSEGKIPLIRLFGIAANDDNFYSGYSKPNIQVISHTTPAGAQAVLYLSDDSEPNRLLTFTLTENNGFSMFVSEKGKKPVLCVISNQEELMQAVYEMHIWIGNQSIFSNGLAIQKNVHINHEQLAAS